MAWYEPALYTHLLCDYHNRYSFDHFQSQSDAKMDMGLGQESSVS